MNTVSPQNNNDNYDNTQETPSAPINTFDVEYKGIPWVSNISSPVEITKGLQNKHLSLWASHGKYYSLEKGKWQWQRPNIFCTNEDLYTQTIVVPYLIPMLEKAGAIVFTPRERDWQKNEIIIDNNNKPLLPYYTEINVSQKWVGCGIKGFAGNRSYYADNINPFTEGTTRMAKTSTEKGCEISYMPKIPESGEYAVYVSYPTHELSVPDAQYTVFHKGRATTFKVNQQMGGGTWVYLGTFDFSAGCNADNRVVLTNVSSYKGVVTADAVRFGGGMGNIKRDGRVSGVPRFLEGSRYYAQWAGAPDSVVYNKNHTDDYKEDINVRSFMTNWVAGGSCFAPFTRGLKVPIELSLAVHSDAGVSHDFSSLIGTLTICTTNARNGRLGSGQSRNMSMDFATRLLNNTENDLKNSYSTWTKRTLYDRNYSETRCPLMTSAIIETLSHQNFPDMRYGQDPNFRFTLARSIYKTILKFIANQHDKPYVVTPLAPTNLSVEFYSKDTVVIRWDAQIDKTEPTSDPTSYILYTATENSGFDNGFKIKGNVCKIKLEPDVLYSFKVTAANDGGESFPSEIISAVYNPHATKTILIVNGFQRLSSPEIVDDNNYQGFNLVADPGVSYGKMPGFCGYQNCYDKDKIGIEGPGGLGYSGEELVGMILRGNEFNYIPVHAKSIMSAEKYNIVSCSKYAVEKDKVNLSRYDCVDLILGLEKDDGHSLNHYKSFSNELQKKLTEYTKNNGKLIVSGAYIGADMKTDKELEFLSNTLHVTPYGSTRLAGNNVIEGMSSSFNIYTTLNEEHYAATSIDVLKAVSPAFCVMTEYRGASVCVAYDGKDCRTFTMGFPFECITSDDTRDSIMRGILNFLLK
ncbi:MAG: fibronectin type III domain-containing protein [Prevotella sp.]|nr:fibronectin type III domain-containing protein [Prevotella sp.]